MEGLHVHDVTMAIDLAPRLLTAPREWLDAIVARGEERRRISRPCKSLLYAAVIADQSLLQEKLVAKVELLKSLGISSNQVGGGGGYGHAGSQTSSYRDLRSCCNVQLPRRSGWRQTPFTVPNSVSA